jgi:PAS domain S-box-containing protein
MPFLLTRQCDGKIFEANAGFENLSGYTLSEAIGKTTVELNLFFNIGARETILKELADRGNVRDMELKFRKVRRNFIGLYSAEVIQINNQPCVISIISDITERKIAEVEREKLIQELGNALSEIKILGGMLPICSSCKKIRNDRGYWQQIEQYVSEHSDAEFSHSLCPDCIRRLYPDMAEGILKNDD